ncbi:MAG: hypothetical protein NZL85_07805 [Fimbriimonadales bacterium]|nr:hypothetical protein [Fimbriimonadales bacterium]
MTCIVTMVVIQLAVIIPLLIVAIRERWPWLLSGAFVIGEATFLAFWAAPLFGKDPYAMTYLFWAGPIATFVSGIWLNISLPPLPPQLVRRCHPYGLILVYLLIMVIWLPLVFFGLFLGEIVGVGLLQRVEAGIQAFLFGFGVTLIFVYLYRAVKLSGHPFPEIWTWFTETFDHSKSVDTDLYRVDDAPRDFRSDG